jgi:hypothetical protein
MPDPEEVRRRLREHLRRILLWLPRTPENFAYVVRAARNYLSRVDPDAQLAVAEEARFVLEALWLELDTEIDLGFARPPSFDWERGVHAAIVRHEHPGMGWLSWWDFSLARRVGAVSSTLTGSPGAGPMAVRTAQGLCGLGFVAALVLSAHWCWGRIQWRLSDHSVLVPVSVAERAVHPNLFQEVRVPGLLSLLRGGVAELSSWFSRRFH